MKSRAKPICIGGIIFKGIGMVSRKVTKTYLIKRASSCEMVYKLQKALLEAPATIIFKATKGQVIKVTGECIVKKVSQVSK